MGHLGLVWKKLLFTGTEVTTGWVREVEEVIVLDEEIRGVEMEEMCVEEEGWDVVGGKLSVSRGTWSVNGDVQRERNLLEDTETGFFEC